MTKQERAALLRVCKRIHELASLERAGFSFSEDEDKRTKELIRPYMSWFESAAYILEDLADPEEGPGAIEYINRYYI